MPAEERIGPVQDLGHGQRRRCILLRTPGARPAIAGAMIRPACLFFPTEELIDAPPGEPWSPGNHLRPRARPLAGPFAPLIRPFEDSVFGNLVAAFAIVSAPMLQEELRERRAPLQGPKPEVERGFTAIQVSPGDSGIDPERRVGHSPVCAKWASAHPRISSYVQFG